ncbi:MAG TPA: enoyl-CoA hydratase-related protein, partial [Devosia sp.]|nr:enoyl-CoA hydratase-related protein [Devosia sp.]
PEQLLVRAQALATTIASKSTAITPYAKRAVRAVDEIGLAEGLQLERALIVEAYGKQDRAEGLRAFAEKRPPAFKGR